MPTETSSMKTLTNPIISDQEFADRIKRVQKLIGAEGLDLLIASGTEADAANVRYFSDFWPLFELGGVAIAPQGEPVLLVGPESGEYARDRSKVKCIRRLVAYRESADPAYPGVSVSTFTSILKDLGIDTPKRIGIGGYLITTAGVLDALREAFPGAEIVNADSVTRQLRSIKSAAEIVCQRRAFEISEAAVQAVLDRIKPGMTEQQAVGIAQEALYANGAEYEGHPTYVLSGRNSSHAISRPTTKVMQRGEIIQLNIGARVSGYSSSVGLPICMGKMPDQMRRLVDFGLEAHHQTIEWLTAGKPASQVAKAYRQYFIDKGFGDNFLYGPCHGLGLMEVEQPWMEETSDYILAENMTFQVDTFVQDENYGLRWENGGRVTDKGLDLYSERFQQVYELDV